jgi:TRAP-type uncharacterized transport system fused permease subunit
VTESRGPASRGPAESRGPALAIEPEVDVERPEAGLSTSIRRAVMAVAVALSVFVLYRVFVPDPRGGLPYRAAFLAVSLALIFICFRRDGRPGSSSTSRWPRSAAPGPRPAAR